MTKEQLIRRGHCCALGCRNCPYTKPRIKGNKKLETMNGPGIFGNHPLDQWREIQLDDYLDGMSEEDYEKEQYLRDSYEDWYFDNQRDLEREDQEDD